MSQMIAGFKLEWRHCLGRCCGFENTEGHLSPTGESRKGRQDQLPKVSKDPDLYLHSQL